MQGNRGIRTDRRRPGLRSLRGFTLLELLVAVVVLAIVMLLALNGLRFGSRSWELQQNRSAEAAGIRVARDYLQRQLALAVPHKVGEGVAERLVFQGRENSLRFVAPMGRGRGGAGRYLFTLALQPTATDDQLVLDYGLLDPGVERLRVLPAQRVVLMEEMRRMQLSYFGSGKPRENDRWRRIWPADAEQLPRLLRLRIELVDGRLPIEFSVALPLREAFDERPEDS